MGEKNPTERVRAMLDERGIEHYDHENGEPLRDLSEAGTDPATSWRMDGANVCAVPNKQGTFDLWIDHCTPEQAIAATVEPNKTAEWRSVALGLFGSLENADLETAKQWIAGNELLREELAYGEAKAATVGGKPEDNPRNYKPNGEPKIPSMNIGADPDWVDWVASLEHKKPSNLTEAVRQLMFEVICFSGDMGPNGNVRSGVDEGIALTEGCIEDWVERIESIAATVGGEQSDKSVRELLDKLIDDLDRLDFEVDHGEMTIGEYEYARDSIVRECAKNVETANRVTS